MKKQLLKTGILLLLTNVIYSQTPKNLKVVIQNEKLQEFTISILQGDNEYSGIVQITKNGNLKPFIYDVQIDLSNLKSVREVVSFEDFNFDDEKEIVIEEFKYGIYIYDRKNGEPKNLFEQTSGLGIEKEVTLTNYIHTSRGSYEKNEQEKTIIISGSCGSMCGSEETYKGDGTGYLKLIRKCEWSDLQIK